MNDKFELINYEHTSLPVKVFLHRIGNVSPHWHDALEILFALDGTFRITVNNSTFDIAKNDLILINQGDIHSLYSKEGSNLIALQIDLENVPCFKNDNNLLRFDLNTKKDDSKAEQLNALRKDLINIIKANTVVDSYNLKKTIIAYDILEILVQNFKSDAPGQCVKNLNKIKQVTKYIKENCQEDLSLNEVADHFGFTPQYFSCLFKKNMGMTFSDYYSDIRLEKTIKDMISTDDSLFDVVIRNGYEDARPFTRAFKKKYGMLPSVYRKNNSSSKKEDEENQEVNYLSISEDTRLSILSNFFKDDDKKLINSVPINDIKKTEEALVDCDNIQEYQKNFSNTCVGVGRAKELLFKEVQDMLTKVHQEIGFQYVNFHGILSDEMMVVTKENGKIFYSFALIDKVLDFITSIGMKPVMQLDFMPELLAKDPNSRIFNGEAIISLPKDLNQWADLITQLLRHLKYKYGHHEVDKWAFTLWNEPDSITALFNIGTPEEFFQFYKVTFETIKKEIPNPIFGGTPMLLITERQKEWDRKFLLLCKEYNLLPNYLELHYYDTEFKEDSTRVRGNDCMEVFKESTHALADYYKYVTDFLKSIDIDLPLFIGEFNATVSHRNYVNDTLLNADFFIKNFIENYRNYEAFSPWCLTDFIQERALPTRSLFHGGLGLMTMNGLTKPSYFAYYFLSKLRSNILGSGENYIVTEDDSEINIVTHNFKKYSEKYRIGERFNVTSTSRYGIYEDNDKLKIHFLIKNIKSPYAIIRKYFVNRNEGSVYDEWVKEGAYDNWDSNCLKSLAIKSSPGFTQEVVKIVNNQLDLSTVLEPLEFQSISIIWRESIYDQQ